MRWGFLAVVVLLTALIVLSVWQLALSRGAFLQMQEGQAQQISLLREIVAQEKSKSMEKNETIFWTDGDGMDRRTAVRSVYRSPGFESETQTEFTSRHAAAIAAAKAEIAAELAG